ncbi:hypothetical protein F5X68DRAFT_213208 [Plectosphaerella plurivora]|uniref:F-box domain-containing protein n=1 Tax=Plectosphaerella plurivora TaxID=936078 RepID=A0A9P8V697_9PEZI|nr:hypothetical protein F5X68DRAFT_213208 [Plectosphaerella plurivora]
MAARLPPEIIDAIIFHARHPHDLPEQSIARLAAVSPPWRAAVERRTFRESQLLSTDLPAFAAVFTHTARRGYLRVIRYRILLPEYPIRRRERYEVQADRDANNAALTEAMRALFAILAEWERGHDDDMSPLHISLDAVYSLTDRCPPGVPHVPTAREFCSIPSQRGMRFQYSYLHLDDDVELPRVRRVTSFCFERPSGRRRQLAPHAFVQIAAALSGLTSLRGSFEDSETAYPALRSMCRRSLADALDAWAVPVGLKHLDFRLTGALLLNHAWQPAQLPMTDGGGDAISDALRKATLQMPELTSLRLEGVLDASLLWPSQHNAVSLADPSLTPPFWQNLTVLQVDFSMTSSSGAWYFRARTAIDQPLPEQASETAMPPGYKSAEPRETTAIYRYITRPKPSGRRPIRLFRLVPDEPVLLPLIAAFALACAQTPTLNTAALSTMLDVELRVGDDSAPVTSNWGIYFAARGHSSPWRERLGGLEDLTEDLRVARLTFNTRQWQPNPEVLDLLRMMPRGVPLREKHIDLWERCEKGAEMTRWPETIAWWRPPL